MVRMWMNHVLHSDNASGNMNYIKKYKYNQYLVLDDGTYIRDFTNNQMHLDLNSFSRKEYEMFLENELMNSKKKYVNIENEVAHHQNVVIISDGYNFTNTHKMLAKLPKDVSIIAVNSALKNWTLVGNLCPVDQKKSINYYVVNNPYEESKRFMPTQHRYYPKCVASTRTNYQFLESYLGNILSYSPTPDQDYSGLSERYGWKIDDYRNPICASIILAHRFKASKILLLNCDDSFKDERFGAIQLENGLYSYEAQIKAQKIIDGCLFWLRKNSNVAIGNGSDGIKLNNATYINNTNEMEILEFFNE